MDAVADPADAPGRAIPHLTAPPHGRVRVWPASPLGSSNDVAGRGGLRRVFCWLPEGNSATGQAMRACSLWLCSVVLLTGCVFKRHHRDDSALKSEATVGAATNAPAGKAARDTKADQAEPKGLIVTPASALLGRIALVNNESRHVVISFVPGALPAEGEKLAGFRRGLKVAELRVQGPRSDNLVTADILQGDCRVEDEVRRE